MLRPEVRHLYNTAAYRRERREFIAIHGAHCRHCGREHRLLNLAHLCHDSKCKLHRALLCPSCHARNDATQRLAMTRRTRARRHGQLWLDAEVALAPYPLRTWPVAVRQKGLFT